MRIVGVPYQKQEIQFLKIMNKLHFYLTISTHLHASMQRALNSLLRTQVQLKLQLEGLLHRFHILAKKLLILYLFYFHTIFSYFF